MDKLTRLFSGITLSVPVITGAMLATTAHASINDNPEYIEGTNQHYYEVHARPQCDNNDRLTSSVLSDGATYDDIYVSVDGYPEAGKYQIYTSFLGDKMFKGVYDRSTKQVSSPVLYVQADNCSIRIWEN